MYFESSANSELVSLTSVSTVMATGLAGAEGGLGESQLHLL